MSIFSLQKRIYLDNAAITPTDKRVLKEMLKFYGKEYGNPSSIHSEGVNAIEILRTARQKCAKFLNSHDDEVVFTGSGTEANNLAIFGVVNFLLKDTRVKRQPNDLHVIISAIEHPSVMECAEVLKDQGVAVDFISVDEKGIVNLKELKEKVRKETCLVSIMYVNNEIGTLQPIHEIAKIIRKEKKSRIEKGTEIALPIYFHTDASQAALYENMNVEQLGVDLMTLDGHKVYGPKGIGALYVRRGVRLEPIVYGGGQEFGLRSGTPNIPGIVGFAKSLEIAAKEKETEVIRLQKLRNFFVEELKKLFGEKPGIVFNGSLEERIVNNINFSLPGVDMEFLVLQLDAQGVASSTKSSCLRDQDQSYVIAALKKPNMSAIRFSLGRFTKKGDITTVLKVLKKILVK